MEEKDGSLLWLHLIFTGNVKASKRLQIEVSVDDGSKMTCPIPTQVSGQLELHEQSRLLAFRLSTVLGIEVIRKSRLPGIKHAEGKCFGSVVDFIKQNKTITLNGGNGIIEVAISLSNEYANIIMKGVDESLGALGVNPAFDRTFDSIDKATYIGKALYSTSKTLSDAFTPLGQALQLMVKIGDGLADAHPLLKASWIVLSSVYKAIQKQKVQDDAVRDLADSLREMLGAANAYPDLREIENTTRVSESIGLAALDIASLIEECTKHESLPARIAQSQFKDLSTRVTQCKQQCSNLLEKFDRRIHLENRVDLKEVKSTLNIELETKEKQSILNWLGAPDPSLNYNAAREKHCTGTGEWFLRREEYKKWKKEPDLPLFLWGAPGFGKTILCSTVVEDIVRHCKEAGSEAAYVYFIFDGRNLQADFQQHGKCIRSIIKQLSHRYTSFPLPLKTLYGDGNQPPPTTANLEDVFLRMIEEFDDVFIIVDSLDECVEWGHFFKWIKNLSQHHMGKLHFFATSRPEYDIKEDLKTITRVDFVLGEDLISDDLGMFIQQKVESSRKLSKLTPKMDVNATVTTNASGMFSLVAFRLDQLQQCLTEADVQDQLADLPNDLDEMYQRMINKLQPIYRQRVLLILQWLAFSMRSITLKEIAEVAATDFPELADTGPEATPRFNHKRRFEDENDVLSICGGLVNVMSFGEIKLSHLSVREYLLSPRRQMESSSFSFSASLAHSAIAKTCIAYLLQFTDGLPPGDSHRRFPLALYAAQHWYKHVRLNDDGESYDGMLHRLTVELLLSGYPLQASTQLSDPHFDYLHYYNSSKPFNQDPTPLYYSALMGLRRATEELLEHEMDPSRTEPDHCHLAKVLMATSIHGSTEIIKMLLGKGVDPNAKSGPYATPLVAVVIHGHNAAVKYLLERGSDPNFFNSTYGAPIHIAARANRTDIVNSLVEYDVDINKKNPVLDNNALQDACDLGFTDMVRLLLDNGADPNYCGKAHALQAAAHNGYIAIVKLLLAHGADPKLHGEYFGLGTAMHAAATSGSKPIVELLMEAGGNLNSEGGKYGGVVQAASASGHSELLLFLLDNGANPHLMGGGKYEHALVTATTAGSARAVELLLQKGINPNLCETKYALQIASANGNVNLAKVLLEHGADPNVLGGVYGSALQAAVNGGFTDVVQPLLEHGADPNVFGPESPSPLYRAAEDGYLAIVELLLNKDANPRTNGGRYKTALHVACNNGHKDIVKLLLSKGGDPNMPGAQGHGNPLHIASTNGHGPIVRLLLDSGAELNVDGAEYAITIASAEGYTDIVEMLLERNANANITGGWYGTPLLAGSLNGHLAIVNLLLDKKANPNAQAGHYGTPLIAASYCGDLSIVDLLLKRGANVHNAGKYNALQIAAANGHARVVHRLIQYGINPDEPSQARETPLQAAAKGGYAEVVKILLENSADPNNHSEKQSGALELSSLGGYTSIVKLLLEKGANPKLSGPEGGPLQAAVISGDGELVNLFLEKGLDPEAPGGRYGSAIKAASIIGNRDVIDVLHAKGYELQAKEDAKSTPDDPVSNSLVVSVVTVPE